MAKISLYDQNQLASARTGVTGIQTPGMTPGVDTSISHMFTGFSQDVGQVKSNVYALMNQEYQQKQAELKAVQRELKSAARSATVGAHVADFSTEAHSVATQNREDHMWNTDTAMEDFTNKAKSLMEDRLATIEDPITKLQTQKALQDKLAEYQNETDKWVSTRDFPIAEAGLKRTAFGLSTELGNVGPDWAEAQRKLEQYETDNLPTYTKVYGDKGLVVMRADQEAGVKQMVSAFVNTNPTSKQLDTFIDNDVVKKYTDPTTITDFMGKQKTIASQERQAAALEQANLNRTKNLDAYGAVISMTTNGDPRTISAKNFQGIRQDPNIWNNLKSSEQKNLIQGQKEAPEYTQSKEYTDKAHARALSNLSQAEHDKADDAVIIRNLGAKVAIVNKLQEDLTSLYIKAGRNPTPLQDAQLQRKYDEFESQYKSVLALGMTPSTPEAKAAAKIHLENLSHNVAQIKSLLSTSPKAANVAYTNRLGVWNDLNYQNPYTNPRKAGVFNYHYTTLFNQIYPQLTPQQVQAVKSNAPQKQPGGGVMGARDALRLRLRKYAAEQVEKAGFFHGQ